MFKKNGIEPLAQHVYLSSPTMHGEEFQYMKEAYDTNWMSTVGANINEVEKCASEKIGCKHAVALSSGTAALHMAIKLAGMDLYGQPEVGHGALEGKRVFCSDMTFAATVNPVVYEGGIPVFIDTEGAGGNGRADGLDADTRTMVCESFCRTIENAGYQAGVYASCNWYRNNLHVEDLDAYKIWLAEYRQTPQYEGRYDMWQYTSSGSLAGIEGRVDLNVSYIQSYAN